MFNKEQIGLKIGPGIQILNDLDLLLLENVNRRLSYILSLWEKYPGKNKDFKKVPRIKAHIRYRENHNGWIFKISGDSNNPIVKLIGLK